MPSRYDLKPNFQALLRPVANRLTAIGVTANQVTSSTCAVSIALGLDLTYGSKRWLPRPIRLFLRMALNAFHGMLASEHGQDSRLVL